MKAKLLLKLAAKLEKLPRGRFRYSQWVGPDWGGKQDLSCGTAACALGWATQIPECGLKLHRTRYGAGYVKAIGQRAISDGFDLTTDTSIAAGMRAFGLTMKEAEYLFLPGHSDLSGRAHAKTVARHIRRFVARGGMPRTP